MCSFFSLRCGVCMCVCVTNSDLQNAYRMHQRCATSIIVYLNFITNFLLYKIQLRFMLSMCAVLTGRRLLLCGMMDTRRSSVWMTLQCWYLRQNHSTRKAYIEKRAKIIGSKKRVGDDDDHERYILVVVEYEIHATNIDYIS